MKSEARMSKCSELCNRWFRHSDFVIPSDFVICHSDLRITVCLIQKAGQCTGESGPGKSASWKLSSHAPFQLCQRQPALRQKTIGSGNTLAARTGFTMKQIMNEPLAGLGLFPDVKLSLGQTERDTFAALVEHNKCHHFFANPILDLTGDGRLSVAKNSATVHDGETVRRERAFPDFANLQLDLRVNAAGGVALAAFAQDGRAHDERRFSGQLFDRKRRELNRPQ